MFSSSRPLDPKKAQTDKIYVFSYITKVSTKYQNFSLATKIAAKELLHFRSANKSFDFLEKRYSAVLLKNDFLLK